MRALVAIEMPPEQVRALPRAAGVLIAPRSCSLPPHRRAYRPQGFTRSCARCACYAGAVSPRGVLVTRGPGVVTVFLRDVRRCE